MANFRCIDARNIITVSNINNQSITIKKRIKKQNIRCPNNLCCTMIQVDDDKYIGTTK